jgi:putative redox protein
MTATTIQWIGGKKFVGIDSTNHSVVLSPRDENVGMRPSELLLVALGSCTAVDVVEILTKKRMAPASLNISVTGEQDAEPPWAFRKIHIKYVVSGNNITEDDVRKTIDLSESKYCSVAATIRGVAEITTEFEIVPMQ